MKFGDLILDRHCLHSPTPLARAASTVTGRPLFLLPAADGANPAPPVLIRTPTEIDRLIDYGQDFEDPAASLAETHDAAQDQTPSQDVRARPTLQCYLHGIRGHFATTRMIEPECWVSTYIDTNRGPQLDAAALNLLSSGAQPGAILAGRAVGTCVLPGWQGDLSLLCPLAAIMNDCLAILLIDTPNLDSADGVERWADQTAVEDSKVFRRVQIMGNWVNVGTIVHPEWSPPSNWAPSVYSRIHGLNPRCGPPPITLKGATGLRFRLDRHQACALFKRGVNPVVDMNGGLRPLWGIAVDGSDSWVVVMLDFLVRQMIALVSDWSISAGGAGDLSNAASAYMARFQGEGDNPFRKPFRIAKCDVAHRDDSIEIIIRTERPDAVRAFHYREGRVSGITSSQ